MHVRFTNSKLVLMQKELGLGIIYESVNEALFFYYYLHKKMRVADLCKSSNGFLFFFYLEHFIIICQKGDIQAYCCIALSVAFIMTLCFWILILFRIYINKKHVLKAKNITMH